MTNDVRDSKTSARDQAVLEIKPGSKGNQQGGRRENESGRQDEMDQASFMTDRQALQHAASADPLADVNGYDMEPDVDAVALDGKVQTEIGRRLKSLYADIVEAPVPKRMLELLAQLESREKS